MVVLVVAGKQRELGAVGGPGWQVGVVGEVGRAVALLGRQGDPQLGGVQVLAGLRGVFGVGDAVAGGHQVDLAGADQLFVAQAVAVQDFAGHRPGEGLQADVRAGADMQAGVRGEVDRADVVEEAPGADHAPVAGGQGAADVQAGAEFGFAGGDALDGGHGFPFWRMLASACHSRW